MTILNQLKAKLPQFTWTQKNSDIFGVITNATVTKRINKDLYKLDNIYVFISSKMGGTIDNPPFRYAKCYQHSIVRPYRCKNTHIVEFNKLFVSDKDLQGIVKQLITQIDMDKFYLSK